MASCCQEPGPIVKVLPCSTLPSRDREDIEPIHVAAYIESHKDSRIWIESSDGDELNVISACVLGGVSLMGGRATISGVLVGVLIMGTAENVMNLLNIDAFINTLYAAPFC